MKKLLSKAKNLKRGKSAKPAAPHKITNDTVAEHRERVLAGGRRYKYPLQYARHKLVINAIVIAIISLVALSVLAWQQLYVAQNSGNFFYRLTKLVPLPVAKVDGEYARYSDYLLNFRPSEYYLSKYDTATLAAQGSKAELDYKKRDALDTAIADAYARKLAGERSITVSEKEVDEQLERSRNADNGVLTAEAYNASVERIFNMSPSDTRALVRNGLLRKKVSFAVDDTAKQRIDEVVKQLAANDNDFGKVADAINKTAKDAVSTGISGLISSTSNFEGIQVSDLADKKVGDVSGVIKSTTDDGYYIVKIVAKNDTQLSFSFIHVPLTKFKAQLKALASDGKIQEYISVPER